MDKNEKRELKQAKYMKQAAKAQAKADKIQAKKNRANSLENFVMVAACVGILALGIAAIIVGATPEEN